jgi:hypothetical protein
MDWLIFLFVFEIIVAAYPNYKKWNYLKIGNGARKLSYILAPGT